MLEVKCLKDSRTEVKGEIHSIALSKEMLELNLYTFPDWNVDLVGGLV